MLFRFFKIINQLKFYFNYEKYVSKYEKHNIKKFNNHNKKEKKILLEFFPSWSSQITFSYLTNVLAKKYDAEIITYLPEDKSFIKKNLYKLFFKFNFFYFKIMKSYGVNKILFPKIINFNNKKYKIDKLYKLKNKQNILDIKINGVLIGDLIYDGYLKKKKNFYN